MVHFVFTKGKGVPLSPEDTRRSRWFAQASAETGPEELPSASSIPCPGRKSKALQNAEGFRSVTVLRKDHWSGDGRSPSAETHSRLLGGEKQKGRKKQEGEREGRKSTGH